MFILYFKKINEFKTKLNKINIKKKTFKSYYFSAWRREV